MDRGSPAEVRQCDVAESDLSKEERKVIEALCIATNENINKRTGNMVWAENAASACVPDINAEQHDRGRKQANGPISNVQTIDISHPISKRDCPHDLVYNVSQHQGSLLVAVVQW